VEERLQTWSEGKKEIIPPQARNVSVEQVDFNAEKLAPSMVDRAIAFEAQPYDSGEDTRGRHVDATGEGGGARRPTERNQQKATTDCQPSAGSGTDLPATFRAAFLSENRQEI